MIYHLCYKYIYKVTLIITNSEYKNEYLRYGTQSSEARNIEEKTVSCLVVLVLNCVYLPSFGISGVVWITS